MNSTRRILLIDKASDRKDRINALKARGYAVFPALKLEEARSRCLRGGYDLVVINSGDEPELAAQFSEDLREQCPKQLMLLITPEKSGRDYGVTSDLPTLLQRVDKVLGGSANAGDYASAA